MARQPWPSRIDLTIILPPRRRGTDRAALAVACLETLKQCVTLSGDWRLGPEEMKWDDARAQKVIEAALIRAAEIRK